MTLSDACQMFPGTPRAHIEKTLPLVLCALEEAGLGDPAMVRVALATIRAESASFEPVCEQPSHYNTSPSGQPFDLYDHRADLGNQGPPDGDRFKGRGFVQLTGRANYQKHGAEIGADLVGDPDRANEPETAARLLASFLKSQEPRIRAAVAAGDLATARKLVNGGRHGLEAFTAAYRSGQAGTTAA
jgi:Chitinase class I